MFYIFLFDDENILFDASLVVCINSTDIPQFIIMKRVYKNQNNLYNSDKTLYCRLLLSYLVRDSS